MNEQTRLALFIALSLTIGMAWATFTPSNITKQPISTVSSVLYGYDSTNHVWIPCQLDTNGNLKISAP